MWAGDYVRVLRRNALGQLSDTLNWQLGTPDAEWLFRKASLEGIIQNLTHHAVAIGRSKIKSWQLKKLVKPWRKWETRLFEEIGATWSGWPALAIR